jgi:hypothetical protein
MASTLIDSSGRGIEIAPPNLSKSKGEKKNSIKCCNEQLSRDNGHLEEVRF